MPDEVFRTTAGVMADDRAMIDHVWANVQRQNRWRSRAWRLLNRLRGLPIVRLRLRLTR